MLRDLLRQRNLALQRRASTARARIAGATICAELVPYRDRLVCICDALVDSIQGSIDLLSRGPDEILQDILSNTDQDFSLYQRLSDDFGASILRSSEADRLSLRTIAWLQREHPETRAEPAAFSSGSCAILPVSPPLYYLPSMEQSLILYQPLLFHEFGHLLYAKHREEMDQLVGELQDELQELLLPASQRDDRFAAHQAAERDRIVAVWYRWAQELYCDAVGFAIGGVTFLKSFSAFLSNTGVDDFYQGPEDLCLSSHPITWLRVQLLADRAERAGEGGVACQLRNEWRIMAEALSVDEDYHGYYVAEAEPMIRSKVEDMLVETDPRRHGAREVRESWQPGCNVVSLCADAWRVFEGQPEDYDRWEQETTARFLAQEM